jgi:Trypsin
MRGRHSRTAFGHPGRGPGGNWAARLPGLALAATGLLAAGLLFPAGPAVARPATRLAPRLAARLAAAAQTLGVRAHRVKGAWTPAVPAGTTAAVGALFRTGPGRTGPGRAGRPQLIRHFCTASVVRSPSGDLLLTAAHCVSGRRLGTFAFVPEYRDGRSPDGVWPVRRVIMGHGWTAAASPDDDVAFLQVQRPPGAAASLQSRTGAERLGIGQPAGQWVRVTGYPNTAAAPVSCGHWAVAFGPAELRFDCAGFADGTSGSALLADVNPLTGLGTVAGVIGGYQQGGESTSVSYADRLGANVAALYREATGQP